MVLRNLVCLFEHIPIKRGKMEEFSQNDAARTDVDQPLSNGSYHHQKAEDGNPLSGLDI